MALEPVFWFWSAPPSRISSPTATSTAVFGAIFVRLSQTPSSDPKSRTVRVLSGLGVMWACSLETSALASRTSSSCSSEFTFLRAASTTLKRTLQRASLMLSRRNPGSWEDKPPKEMAHPSGNGVGVFCSIRTRLMHVPLEEQEVMARGAGSDGRTCAWTCVHWGPRVTPE